MTRRHKGRNAWNTTHISIYDLNTHRFLDFFFLVPPGPTSQLQGDPALNWGERKERTHCIIQPPHRKRALQAHAETTASSDNLQQAMTTQVVSKQISPWSVQFIKREPSPGSIHNQPRKWLFHSSSPHCKSHSSLWVVRLYVAGTLGVCLGITKKGNVWEWESVKDYSCCFCWPPTVPQVWSVEPRPRVSHYTFFFFANPPFWLVKRKGKLLQGGEGVNLH